MPSIRSIIEKKVNRLHILATLTVAVILILASLFYPTDYAVERWNQEEGCLLSSNRTRIFEIGDVDIGREVYYECQFNSVGTVLPATYIVRLGQTTSLFYLDWKVGYIKSQFSVKSLGTYVLLLSSILLEAIGAVSYVAFYRVLVLTYTIMPDVLFKTAVATIVSGALLILRHIAETHYARTYHNDESDESESSTSTPLAQKHYRHGVRVHI